MSAPPSHPHSKRWSWRSQAFRALVYQVLAVAVITLLVLFLAHNTATNMRQRGMQSGFGFLLGTAGFDIGESLFTFDPGESYLQAYLVGVTNTLRVAVLGIVLTTVLGTLIGVGRFSRNALVRGLCRVYVEAFRNIPVLLQLLMWYLLFSEFLPSMAEAWEVGPFFLSKGGLNFPIPVGPTAMSGPRGDCCWVWARRWLGANTRGARLRLRVYRAACSGCRWVFFSHAALQAGCWVARQRKRMSRSEVRSPSRTAVR